MEKEKIILDLCGGIGAWSKPYEDRGYKVINVDIKYGWDIRSFFYYPRPIPNSKYVYGILAAPPCPMFSFCRTNAKKPRNLQEGMALVIACLEIIWFYQYKISKDTQKKPNLKFWALENPNGMLKWFLGKPVLEFQPFEYGDNYKKKTHLWGYFNEPKKNPIKCTKPKFDKLTTKEIAPKYYGKLTRQERRAITPQGFAQAFYEANK